MYVNYYIHNISHKPGQKFTQPKSKDEEPAAGEGGPRAQQAQFRMNLTKWIQDIFSSINDWLECVFIAVETQPREITSPRKRCWMSHIRQTFQLWLLAGRAMLALP
jgi:hypothetical protein